MIRRATNHDAETLMRLINRTFGDRAFYLDIAVLERLIAAGEIATP